MSRSISAPRWEAISPYRAAELEPIDSEYKKGMSAGAGSSDTPKGAGGKFGTLRYQTWYPVPRVK